jgi:ABC-2 type transport system permease protein
VSATGEVRSLIGGAPGRVRAQGVASDTWLLLSLRWQAVWNGFTHRSTLQQVGTLIGFIAAGGAIAAGSTGVGLLAGTAVGRFPQAHLDSLLPGLILTAIALLLLVTSFGVELGSLFLSTDLELLMTAPVDRRAVFISKVLDSVGMNYGLILVGATPALVAYGLALHYGPLYYLFMIIALIGAPLLPEGIGALLVMLVARFAPARRVREVMGAMAAIFGLSCSLLGQTSRIWMGQFSAVGRDPAALKAQVDALAGLPLPWFLGGRGLVAAGVGDWAGAVVGLSAYLAVTFGFFAVCVALADRLYGAGWVRMQSGGASNRSKARLAQAAAPTTLLSRAPADLAIALKDWRIIPRDLRMFAQVLGPLIALPIVYLNLLGGSGRRSLNLLEATSELTRGTVDPTGVFVSMGVLMATALVCAQIASTAISMEAQSWWLLKIAPISPGELLRGKFLVSWLPFVVVSTVLMVAAKIWQGFSLLGLLYGWFGVELLGAGIIAIALGAGMRWPRLVWQNPKQMNNGWATLVSFLGQAVLGLIGGAFLCLPLVARVVAPEWELAAWPVAIIGAVAATAGFAWAMLTIGLDHLPEVGEA